MIHSLSANKSSFHRVEFTAGLNVILADRSDTSTTKDTRNGLGKSTLIEILDFCLGGRASKGKGLIIDPLKSWEFTMEVTLAQRKVKVTRSVDEHNRVVISGDTTGWPEQPDVDDETGQRVFKIERWRTLLGLVLFGLPRSTDSLPYKPSYRSLVSYFVRRRLDAYMSPFSHYRQQKTWDIQLHTAYLLGMNWEYAARWQGLKDQEEGVKAIEKAIKTGALEATVGSVGELETQRIQLEQQKNASQSALESFKVHPQYESIQSDADRLTAEIHALTNKNIEDRRRLTRYETSIAEEKPPASLSLEKLYKEAGLVLPNAVVKSLGDARSFHAAVVTNRKEFLDSEMKRLRESIARRETDIADLTNQRAEVMEILKTHGALQEMTKLQERYVTLQGNLDRVETRLHEMKELKETKRKVKAEKSELVKTAEQDHEQRRDVWSTAVRLFNEHSQSLYKTPGKLVIDVADTGYKYSVDIERSGSEGIDKMKIFCFDLAVLQLQKDFRDGVDFLIHDTLMYDSVDARQRALALERAQHVVSGFAGQYICTMNSDMVPRDDFSDEFDFDSYVRLTLDDATPAGSLLGFRFERPAK